MKKIFIISSLFSLICIGAANAIPLTGFYQTIDDETKQPKSIVMLYEYKNGDDVELAGRIVALYDVTTGKISETLNNPVRVADKVAGAPKMAGMDILWNMEWDSEDARYEDGKIMDPKKGNIYSALIWADKTNSTKLQVRGKIGPFGRTQTWNAMKVSDLPADIQKLDTKNWTPVVVK